MCVHINVWILAILQQRERETAETPLADTVWPASSPSTLTLLATRVIHTDTLSLVGLAQPFGDGGTDRIGFYLLVS